MDSLFAAYGAPVAPVLPAKKKKDTNRVIRVTLPVSKAKKEEEEEERSQKKEEREEQLSPVPSPLIKRSILGISDMLPSAKKQKTTLDVTESREEEIDCSDDYGPQMPSVEEIAYYQNYYHNDTQEASAIETKSSEITAAADISGELVHCQHIPELERNIIIGRKRRGENPVFVDVKQSDLKEVTDWEIESDKHYRATSALNAQRLGAFGQKNHMSSLVSNSLVNEEHLDSRLGRIRKSKAQVKGKYGW